VAYSKTGETTKNLQTHFAVRKAWRINHIINMIVSHSSSSSLLSGLAKGRMLDASTRIQTCGYLF